jgi:hypothetical protein
MPKLMVETMSSMILPIRASLVGRHVGKHSLVAARDVVPDARRRDRVLVREDAADGHPVALVVVGHQRRCAHGWMLLAPPDLVQRALLDRVAEDRHSVDQLHLLTSLTVRLETDHFGVKSVFPGGGDSRFAPDWRPTSGLG